MPSITKRTVIIAVVGLASAAAAFAILRPSGHHGHHMHGAHNEHSMPGLNGENASPEESEEMRVLFRNFETLSREVTNLPDGIHTITRSSDPAVMEALVSHVIGMIDRVDQADDPKVMIQSPTLDIFFLRGDRIVTTIDVADEGVIVTQTSDDPEMVEALHTHAAEVSDMAARGMQAVHEMMAARANN